MSWLKIKNNLTKIVKKNNIIKKHIFLIVIILVFYFFGFFTNSLIIKKQIAKEKINTLHLLLSNFISYAPDVEDFSLFYIFYNIPKGFYIDVGSNDPNEYSVTKAFYDRGWNGINVEPLPDKYQLLLKFRPRDINLKLGAGKSEGNANLIIKGIIGLGDQSSLDFDQNVNNVNNSKIININIKTMSNICREYVPKGIEIQFCKIDVERSEKNVLLGYDFVNYRPKVFCIESLINKKTKIPEYKEWEYILISNDYEFAFKYRRNRFYVDNRIKGFKKKFLDIG